MPCNKPRDATRCPYAVGRRNFLMTMGASALAVETGLLEFASSLFAAETRPAGRPVVKVVFIRPEKPFIVSWPGGNCDTNAQQALFTKTLRDAAEELDVQLEVRDQPMMEKGEVAAYVDALKQSPPDGLIVGAMCLSGWDPVNQIVNDRGDVPSIIYSHVSGFTAHLQCGRNAPRTFMGATQDVGWLSFALRMLSAIWQMKNTRILVVAGAGSNEQTFGQVGTTFHWIPKARFQEEFAKVRTSKEVRAIAKYYRRNAKKIVEPSDSDVLEAAKNYVACRRLMEAEQCQGIAIDCLGWENPVCVAFSRLLDEGIVAACECDLDAAASMLLTHLLFERPGFIQDPSPNTINNTLIGAHCTSPTRLEGFDKPYRAPFLLRNYHTRTGVSPQVLWPIGEDVTIMKFEGPDRIILGTGRVVSNIAQPPSGCCRTAVEISLDGVEDSRDAKGFHQLFICGDLERQFKAYCKLAGINVVHV
ncbi:MAG TPA: hypothetical protein VM492_07725 [Sumerlaeia bacterium]|nr:hypothetical protein [Sumerlaeia bacterium]